MKTLAYIAVLTSLFSCKNLANDQKNSGLNTEDQIQYRIAYNVLVDEEKDDYEVFSMDLDGSDKMNITNLKGVEWTYYAKNDHVYFVSDRDTTRRHYQLYKMKADGREKTKICDIRLADSWHGSRKNESEFIVRPHHSVDTAFYIIDRKGDIINKLRPNLKYFNDPSFSPDGNKIIFRGAHYASKREKEFVDEIYSMDVDGTNLKQLTHYPKSDTTAMWYAYKSGPPKWHPTENFISYASFQNGKYSLFGVAPDGTKQWKLTNNMQSEVYHDWSSDGKWLVTDFSINDRAPYHIGLVNWETKAVTILTESTYQYHQSPVFVEVKD